MTNSTNVSSDPREGRVETEGDQDVTFETGRPAGGDASTPKAPANDQQEDRGTPPPSEPDTNGEGSSVRNVPPVRNNGPRPIWVDVAITVSGGIVSYLICELGSAAWQSVVALPLTVAAVVA